MASARMLGLLATPPTAGRPRVSRFDDFSLPVHCLPGVFFLFGAPAVPVPGMYREMLPTVTASDTLFAVRHAIEQSLEQFVRCDSVISAALRRNPSVMRLWFRLHPVFYTDRGQE